MGFADGLAVALDFGANELVAVRVGAGFGALPDLLAFFIKVLVDGFAVALGFAIGCLVAAACLAGIFGVGLLVFFI